MIICLEGVNGCGKTTQARNLVCRIQSTWPSLQVLPWSDPIRVEENHINLREMAKRGSFKSPMARLMIYAALRCELNAHIDAHNRPGSVIVLDRYAPSFYVYAYPAFANISGFLSADDIQAMVTILKACGCVDPDVSIYLHVSPEEAERRFKAVNQDTGQTADVFEQEGREKFHARGEHYRCLAKEACDKSNSYYRYLGNVCVEVETDGLSESEVADRIWEPVHSYIQHKLGEDPAWKQHVRSY